jgi:hypothetical protein
MIGEIVPIWAIVPYRFAAPSIACGIPARSMAGADSLITLDFSERTVANQPPLAPKEVSYLG